MWGTASMKTPKRTQWGDPLGETPWGDLGRPPWGDPLGETPLGRLGETPLGRPPWGYPLGETPRPPGGHTLVPKHNHPKLLKVLRLVLRDRRPCRFLRGVVPQVLPLGGRTQGAPFLTKSCLWGEPPWGEPPWGESPWGVPPEGSPEGGLPKGGGGGFVE